MGTTNQNMAKDDLEKFQLIRKNEYPSLCIISEVLDTTNEKYYYLFKSLYTIDNKEREFNEVKKQKSFTSLSHSGELVNYHLQEAKQLCFENYILNMYFEYTNRSLQRLLREYRANNTKMTEDQAWLILNFVAEHLKSLDSIGSMHGDLKPEYIFFTDDMTEIKILNPLSYTKFGSSYSVFMGESKSEYRSPLSPELLDFLKIKAYYPHVDNIKSDLFSLSLIVLTILIKENWEDFYNFQKYSIELNKIKISLAKLIKLGYSEELFWILDQSLKTNAMERPHINEFLKMSRFKYKEVKKRIF